MAQNNLKRDPLKTKTGKIKLFGLNLEQLNKLLVSTSKPKDKAKINVQIEKRTTAVRKSVV